VRLTHHVELLVACAIAPAALAMLPATRVLRAIARMPRRRGTPAEPELLAQRVDAVLGRLPGLWRWTCLKRAIAIAALLRRDGHAVTVRIGVRRNSARGDALEAHAWLACDGVEPYLEPEGSDPSTFRVLEGGTPLGGGARRA
jgi:Transglutaminase-like superfamily